MAAKFFFRDLLLGFEFDAPALQRVKAQFGISIV